jgi:dTDP-L-rhamnose 4-epimerase
VHVLITGGAGFIGSATAEALAAAGHSVTVLDTFSEQIHGDAEQARATEERVARSAEVVRGDVRDRSVLDVLVPRSDVVVHLAAETGTGQSMYDITHHTDVNVGGTAALLETLTTVSHDVRRVVVASSRSIYGEGSYRCPTDGIVHPPARVISPGRFDPVCPVCGGPVVMALTAESAALSPASVYAATKLAQENLVLAVARARGLSAYALRYQNVYGAGQSLNNPYTGILAVFAREMLAGRPIEIFEDGLESRDFVHVADVAAVNVAAVTTPRDEVASVNIGTGRAVSVNEVARLLAAELGFSGDIRVSGRSRSGDIRHNAADIDLARRTFGFEPRIGVEEGLAEFCRWARRVLEEQGTEDATGYVTSLQELESRGLMSTTGAGESPRG